MFPRNVLILLFVVNGAAFGQATQTKLEFGNAIERNLGGSEAHSYQLDLARNQYAEVVVDQRGIDLAIWAYNSKGEKLFEANTETAGGQESILLVSDVAESYRLEVRASSAKAPAGSYQIKIKELRPATEQDRYSCTAWRLVVDAIQFERQASAAATRNAIEKYQQSLKSWRLAGSPLWEAYVFSLMAADYSFLGEKQKALEFASQALPIAAAAASNESNEEKRKLAIRVHAFALDMAGQVQNQLGDKKKALEYLYQALPLHKSAGDRTGELYTIGRIATAYQYMGDFQKALTLSREAITIAKELGDQAKEGTLLNNLCVLYEDLGNAKQALNYCTQALSIRHNFDDRFGEAQTLGNMAGLHAALGDYQTALDFYRQSHDRYKSLENRSGQGIQLHNMGWVYDTLGDYDKAIEFYNKAAEIFTAEDDQYRLGNVLSNMASSYMGLGDYRKGLELHLKVLPMRRAVNNNNGAAITLRHIANAYAHLNEKQKALDYFQQSIQLLKQNPQQLTLALRNLGSLYLDLGEQQHAIQSFNEALQVSRSIGDRLGEAGALALLAQVERDRGNLTEAKRLIETALASVESLRVNLKSQQLRTSFFASVRKYHELYIDVLMRLHQQHAVDGFDGLALQASENARARSLRELLMEGNAEIRQGVDAALIEREQKVRQAISAKAEAQMRLLSGKHTDEEAKRISDELDLLANEYEDVQANIRRISPRYAALTQPVALSLKEIQSQLLDENTVLLEYSLGEDRSFVWAVSQDSLRTFELPKRAEVETAARNVYQLLTTADHDVANESTAALSKMLLGPVAAELKHKRLLIVAEGVLQYVPFSALSEPDESGAPLIAKHEIVTLPSASVLAVLRQERRERVPAPKSIAVFADPVFDPNDARLTSKTQTAHTEDEPYAREVQRSGDESGLAGFARLRFSREEANQIMKLASRRDSLQALDFAANRSAATSSDLQNYRIVHFATHGIINSRHAELSGIVLSLVDREGKPQNGFLRVYDVYNMNLRADLVVLSACQTALGKDIKGEGLVGLTRAFMYGGATRVVATLWQSDDRATAVLMTRFYEALLSRGLSPAAALHTAQVSMSQDKRWHHPRYWAGFTIQGEWK
jgi:CHAT domain-containing protein/tetratricopeptide (TPR) repeat protein